MTIEFEAFPKLARLNRPVTISEKLDGTNAAVRIVEQPLGGGVFPDFNRLAIIARDDQFEFEYHIYAQSRNRFITLRDDNYGFAKWVEANAEALVNTLGAGTHFGEWWGSGIQRGYGLKGGDKRFSLFNTSRWENIDLALVDGLALVPVLYQGPFNQGWINGTIEDLRENGSLAAPGFRKPEGIVIWHEAARLSFKVTLVGDEAPKQGIRNAHDLLPEKVAA